MSSHCSLFPELHISYPSYISLSLDPAPSESSSISLIQNGLLVFHHPFSLHNTLQLIIVSNIYFVFSLSDRILLTVVVIFRILIVAIVGETIILVCTPSLCFITYSVHQSAKQRDRRYSFLYPLLERSDYGQSGTRKLRNINGILVHHGDGGGKDEHDCMEVKEIPNVPRGLTHGKKSKQRQQEGISRFYIIQVVFRNALEIGFLVGQYFLYGFSVPGIFECDRYPCLKEVECYVSRPTEKTVFLVFMFAVSGICVLLNLAELNHLGWKKIKAAIRGVQARRKSICEIRKKDMSHLSQPPNMGRTQSSESAYV
ncbi:unnamed protein product [Oncorhynchus mykiss]|uniref:Gap junction protein n=1 Tax=Oncorhynchus mykiss TaxID=8022 RepID=A0A060XD14_ONCMY|nr:unnamed protein product [Oncorhynchus mykiss]